MISTVQVFFTVLAKTNPADVTHEELTAIPNRVATDICTIAPGMAILRTAFRSAIEKCIPTPNIKNITPNSAN